MLKLAVTDDKTVIKFEEGPSTERCFLSKYIFLPTYSDIFSIYSTRLSGKAIQLRIDTVCAFINWL